MAKKPSTLDLIRYDVLKQLPPKAKELCKRYPHLLKATVSGTMETVQNFVKSHGGVIPW